MYFNIGGGSKLPGSSIDTTVNRLARYSIDRTCEYSFEETTPRRIDRTCEYSFEETTHRRIVTKGILPIKIQEPIFL